MTSTALDLNHHPATALAIQPGQIAWDKTQLAALSQLGLEDAGDGDRAVFLHVCQRTGLDPFARQIYMIGRNEKKSEKRNGQWVDIWTKKWTIQTGIDGFRVNRSRAERNAGVRGVLGRAIFYDLEGNEHRVWVQQRPPAACEITYTVRDRDGGETPYTSVLRFSEYVQLKDGNPIAQWATKPAHMLEKCLPGRTRIHTDQGTMRIADIVDKRLPVKVRSIDLQTGRECWQSVVNWWRNGPTAEWVRIWAPSGIRGDKPLRLTPNHPIWTPTGWYPAGDLKPGDLVAVASPVLSPEQEQVILGSLLGDGSLGGRKRVSSLPLFTEAHGAAQRDYLEWKAAALASLKVTRWTRMQSDGTGGQHETEWMRTRAVPALYWFRDMKPADMLAALDDLGLAVWFMDDGQVKMTGGKSGSRSLAIHCCGFGPEFADAAVAWLDSQYRIPAHVLRREHNPIIAIGSADADRLLGVIAPWVRADGTVKTWIGDAIPQGHDGHIFVPVLATERIVKPEAEQRYDIEVEGTHTFIAGGLVISNCTEADVYRKAFPQDFSGIYLDDTLPPQQDGPPAPPRGRVTAGEIISRQEPAAEDDTLPGSGRAAAGNETRAAAGEVRTQTDPRAAGAASPRGAQPPPPQPEDGPAPARATTGQLSMLGQRLGKLGVDDENRLGTLERLAGHDLAEPGHLTQDEAAHIRGLLDRCKGDRGALVELLATGQLPEAGDGDG
jgi:phage recombination protein Bet